MIVVDGANNIPALAVLAVHRADGLWDCYMPGDNLPDEPEQSHEELARKMVAPYADAVQAMLDATAQDRSYDGILSMVSYAGDSHPKFGPEGAAANAWRTACWTQCYEILAAVESGKRVTPTVAELLSEMPALVI